jgi:integrase
VLTGARREEVAGVCWDELRKDDALRLLPSERSKNGEANSTPLSTLAAAEIDALAAVNGKWPRRGLIFSTTGKTAVSGYSRAKKRLDAAISKENDDEPLDA